MIVESVEKDELRDCEGLTIAEVAERTGKHPIDAMLDLAVEDELKTTFVTPPRERSEGEMEAIKEVCNSDFALPGVSDGGAHTKFITLGAYTTEYLTKLVRDEGVMDLEQAHWRLSAYPALAAGIKDRGWIREGAPRRHRGLRLREPRAQTPGEGVRLPSGRVAARKEGIRLPLDARKW